MNRMSTIYKKSPAARTNLPMQSWNVKEDEDLLQSDNETLPNSEVYSETKHPISEDDNYTQSLSPSRPSGSSAHNTIKDFYQSREFLTSSDDQALTSRTDQVYKPIMPRGTEKQLSSLTSPSHIITKSSVSGRAASLCKIKTKTETNKSMVDSVGNNVATSRSASAYSPYNASTSRSGASHKSPSVSSWKSLDAVDMKEHLKKSSNPKKPTVAKRNLIDPRLGGTPRADLESRSPVLKVISNDPFKDFQDAMVDIILENELKSLVDLEEFFDCYLKLTSPAYQDLVNQFFSDFCNELTLPESSLNRSTDD